MMTLRTDNAILPCMFLKLCILFWCGCLGALAWQGGCHLLGAEASLTVADAIQPFLDLNSLTLLQHIPLEWAAKLTYVLVTTQLALALWWIGLFFCVTGALLKIIRR